MLNCPMIIALLFATMVLALILASSQNRNALYVAKKELLHSMQMKDAAKLPIMQQPKLHCFDVGIF